MKQPLLMIGMVAFIIDIPTTFTSSATAMPVQIYMWSDSAEKHFMKENTVVAFLISIIFSCCIEEKIREEMVN